jgi:hypothetical protein
LPRWEQPGAIGFSSFVSTTTALLSRPKPFFRALPPVSGETASAWFARIHWGLSAVLFGLAGWAHYNWFATLGGIGSLQFDSPVFLALCLATYAAFVLLTALAVRLTAWEAAYRGLRLPRAVVRRALHYHAAHYFPVALLAAATVLGYQLALKRDWLTGTTATGYLYVLSAEIVLSAGYLFSTYWTAMRNLMYANR